MDEITKKYFEKQINFALKHFSFKDCPYYPCHKIPEGQSELNCFFCYCPFYPCLDLNKGGKWINTMDNKKIWDCSDCNYIHQDKIVLEYLKYIYKITNL